MKRFIITSLVMGIALLGLQAQAQANLLSDPGFEYSNPVPSVPLRDGPWTWSGGTNGDAFYDGLVYRNGEQAAKTVICGGTSSDYAYFVEEGTGINFSVPYTFSGWFWNDSSEPLRSGSDVTLQVRWYNNSSVLLRVDESAIFDTSYSVDTWHLLSITTPTPPAGSVKVGAVVALVTDTTYTPNSAVWTDDMDFDAVPEPATMLLFSSGLVGLFGFSRRKRS